MLCEPLTDTWVNAVKSQKSGWPRRAVVFGAQLDDPEKVMAGYAVNAGAFPCVVLDMIDIATFKHVDGGGSVARLDQSFNLFWVMTHELLGHHYLKLGHGETGPVPYKVRRS